MGHQMTKMDLCSSVLLDLELGPNKSRDLRPLRSSARAALCSLQATNTSCSSARTILTCFSMEKTLEMKLRSPAPPTSPCPRCTCCAASRQSRGQKDAGCTCKALVTAKYSVPRDKGREQFSQILSFLFPTHMHCQIGSS